MPGTHSSSVHLGNPGSCPRPQDLHRCDLSSRSKRKGSPHPVSRGQQERGPEEGLTEAEGQVRGAGRTDWPKGRDPGMVSCDKGVGCTTTAHALWDGSWVRRLQSTRTLFSLPLASRCSAQADLGGYLAEEVCRDPGI